MSEVEDTIRRITALTQDEAKIYSLILVTGNVTAGDLALLSGSSLESVGTILNKLQRERLVIALPGIIPRYQCIPPFEGLAKQAEKVGERIEQVREELRTQIETASTTIRNAMLSVAQETLKSLGTHETEIKRHRTEDTAEINTSISRVTNVLKDALKAAEGMAASTYEHWKESIVNKIGPTNTELKSSLASKLQSVISELKSWSGDAKNTVDSANSEIGSRIDAFEKRVKSTLESQSNTVTSTLRDLSLTAKNGLQKTRTSVESRVAILGEQVGNTANETANRIIAEITNTEQTFKQSIEKTTERIVELTEHLEEQAQKWLEDWQSSEQQRMSEYESKVSEMTEAVRHESDGAIDTFRGCIVRDKDKMVTKSNAVVSSLIEQLTTFANSSEAQLSGAMSTMQSTSSKAVQEMYQTTSGAVNELEKLIEKTLDGSRQELRDRVEAAGAEIKNLSQENFNASRALFDSTKTALREQLNTLLAITSKSLDELSEQTAGDLQRLAETVKQQITSVVEEAIQRVRTVKDSVTSQIESAVKTEMDSVSEQITRHLEEQRTRHTEFARHTDDLVRQQLDAHAKTISELVGNTSTRTQQILERTDVTRRQCIGTLESAMSELRTSSTNSIKKMVTESVDLIKQFESVLEDSLTELVDAANSEATTISQQMTHLTERVSSETSSHLMASGESLKQIHSTARETISTALQGTKKDAQETGAQFSREISEVLAERSGAIKTELTEIGKETKQEFLAASTEATRIIDGAINELLHNLETASAGVKSSLTTLGSDISNVTIETKNQVNGLFGELIKAIDKTTESHAIQIQKTIETTKQVIDETSQSLTAALQATGEEFWKNFTSGIRQSEKDIGKEMATLAEGLNNDLVKCWDNTSEVAQSFKRDVQQLIDRLSGREIAAGAEEVLVRSFPTTTDVGQEIAKTLLSTWKSVGTTDYPGARKTWTISTRKAVLTHTRDMIERAKSKVTLIVTTPDEIPIELLSKLKSTIGVEIVVTEGPTLSAKAKPILGKGNIRVRVRDEKDVYACVRDSEEMLLAPAGPKDEEVIGVVTEDEGFVRFVMGIVGPIFQSKARLLRPEDLG